MGAIREFKALFSMSLVPINGTIVFVANIVSIWQYATMLLFLLLFM